MNKIKLLDKKVSNMIAAGEVVERPASVIKELLENSIDANAKYITVEIKNGGVKYIRVADDGIGMTKEDAALSLLRHATSKIEKAEDLDAIFTLGFRGEALASISAVSNMEIYTKARGEKEGTLIKSSCGEITDTCDAGCKEGTTVIVRDLFVNTPARMKFLKKEHTEASYIADIIVRLALARPDISFKFINNDKEQLFTSGDGELLNTIYSIYGKDIKNAMAWSEYSEYGISLHGYFGKGQAARANRNMQNVFINGRYIKSPLVSRAVEEAYKQELMVGKFPSFVINVDIDPHFVDINVHPTKLEAKFSDEKSVYHVVYWAAKNALYQKKTIPVVEKKPAPLSAKAEESLFSGFARRKNVSIFNETSRFEKKDVSPVVTNIYSQPKEETKTETVEENKDSKFDFDNVTAVTLENINKTSPVLEFIASEKNVFIEKQTAAKENSKDASMQEDTEKTPEKPIYKICGQIFDTYIVIEKDGQMMMVDQHAAHERLRFERLKEDYKNRNIASQTLLTPAIVKLTPPEMASFCEYKESICALGFDAEEFGETDIILRGVPTELTEFEIKEAIIEIIGLFSSHRKNIDEQIAEKMLYQIACKGAIKASRKLFDAEIRELLDNIFALSQINTCPHGRPITIAFTKEFIEKQFKRIV
ncbi:MAG: DNA mismatch repair endonuclease MutL [Ruminococcaceae bacterium]|nr:DNA mismatch repair endonuclease MutL [Oscillospiraceae bacterium]